MSRKPTAAQPETAGSGAAPVRPSAPTPDPAPPVRPSSPDPLPERGGTRPVLWDGLGLTAPAAWEPARLGLGYLMLEDASGPRLTLRWQRLKAAVSEKRLLKLLARRGDLKPNATPSATVRAVTARLPGAWEAKALADVTGRGGEAVLFTLPEQGPEQGPGQGPDQRLAVLAAVHSREGEAAAPWASALSSLAAADQGLFSLYDVTGQAPPGFTLSSFAVQLGHFRFLYRRGTRSLEFHRFAPAEVILKGLSLQEWAARAFPARSGKALPFASGYLGGSPAARYAAPLWTGAAGRARLALARVFTAASYARVLAWRPDASKVLAVVAAHGGELSLEAFEEVCERYVVCAP